MGEKTKLSSCLLTCDKFALILVAIYLTTSLVASSESPITSVQYMIPTAPDMQMNMSDTRTLTATIEFRRDMLKQKPSKAFASIFVYFSAETFSPQFQILTLIPEKFEIPLKDLETKKYSAVVTMTLRADYIGHAVIKPVRVQIPWTDGKIVSDEIFELSLNKKNHLNITITKYEGIWNTIFIISVIIFIIISYINLGAQLDTENLAQMIKAPTAIILGLIISVIVMPSVAWLVGWYLLSNQMLFRFGSFVFACGPAASASSLWTVMLESDKELSVGLQVLSTVGALISMPWLLYMMDLAQDVEDASYKLKVPYAKLIQTIIVLLISLAAGWWLASKHKKAKQFSQRIFRPLTFAVLLFIIISSSIIYWYIYQMFDWTITLACFIITMITYSLSGLLGYLISFDKDQAIPISIGSTYKNSGIAFAVLVLAFDAPDSYIAYVPCLTQVVMTSLVLYIIYTIMKCVKLIQRRNQPEPIQAVTSDPDDSEPVVSAVRTEPKQLPDMESEPRKSLDKAENDEFIPLNVTDSSPGSPSNAELEGNQTEPSGEV